MSDPLGIIGAGISALDSATSDGKIYGWVGSQSNPDQRITISVAYDRHSIEVPIADGIADAIMTLPESQTFRHMVAAHGPGSMQISVSSLESSVTGTFGYGSQHVMVIAARDIGTQYLSTDREVATFSVQHAVAHEFVHALTDLKDEHPLFNDVVNVVLAELQDQGFLQFGPPRLSYDAILEDSLQFSAQPPNYEQILDYIGLSNLRDLLPDDSEQAAGFVFGALEAQKFGSHSRDNGSIEFWSNGVSVGQTNATSYYSDGLLDNYGTVNANGHASVSLGGHVRALGDWLGLDGQFGIQGNFSKPGEGTKNDDDISIPDGLLEAVAEAINSQPEGPGSEGSSSSSSGDGNTGRSGGNAGTGLSGEDRPIILDLDGSGVEITQLSQSTVFVDSSGDGLKNQTAWAAAGNGVLFYDADGDGVISETREYVFTEWDLTATSDIEALRSVFDSNGDGVFDANDEKWSDFKVLVTLPDGSLVAKTLDELGITSIDLTADATNIELPDGSVITGQTTFTKSDGTTGTVADTTLVSNTQSYRIEESETIDTEGVRTHIQTGYGADGAISFVITSVTSADGTSIANSYDDNGDGVVDRLQTIVTVTNPDGSKSETVTNKAGSDAGSAVLVNATKTTTSADGKTVTIERDSTGGGWYDQTEVRTTHADDSMIIVTTDRGSDGSVIRSSTETVSADGLTRTDAIDEDGDGTVDLTISHVIVVNADGTRSETIRHLNEDGSLRSAVTESVSADGRTKTITRDLDGDGDADVQEELNITVNADKSTSSTVTVKNGDGSVRSTTTQNQSEDALTKTTTVDQDGDGDVDLTTVESTAIHGDDSRETVTTQTNTDGSVRGKVKVTLGSDKVSSETWIDHNQDGVFQSTDLSRSVTVDGTTGERTTTSWVRNADGSFSTKSISVTSEDGLVTNTSTDADGDGDTDRSISDVTVENADGTSTRTVTEKAQDGALISKQQSVTSADGLTVTTLSDIDGDGSWDGKSVSTRVSNPDGSTLHTVTNHAGDQTTLLSQTTVSQSADRRLTITNTDANGDGAMDVTLRSEQHADGSRTELETRLNADGSTRSTQTTNVSDDKLTVTVASDLDGNGTVDTSSITDTVLNADGGRTTTTTVKNGNDSLRSQMVTTVSDDGLVSTTSEDKDGDGTSERVVASTTVLNAVGSKATTQDVKASDGSLLSRTQTTVSDDGLTIETRADRDGDETADIVTSSVTTLNADGGRTVTTEVTDVTGSSDAPRSRTVITTSDDGRDVLETRDVDGDGNADLHIHRVVGDDGQVTVTETKLDDTGATQSQMVSTTSDDGLEDTTRYDADGNGAFEKSIDSTTVLNADGSTTRTVEEKTENGTVYRRAVIETSRDGRTTTTREDRDNDGDYDLTATRSVDLNAAGVETTTVTRTAANGATLSSDTTVVSADERTVTRSIDADGNGVNDQVITTTLADDGTQTSQTQSFNDAGTLIATQVSTVSDDGLTTTSRTDRNGDGTDELVATATTALAADGSRTTTTSYTDGGGALQAKTVASTSDDGFNSTWTADLDGDGTNEFVTTRATTFEADGDVVQTATTVNSAGATIGSVTTTTSGNGLNTSAVTDLNGDGATDRTSTIVEQASGAWTQTDNQFGANASLVQSTQTSEAADGRTRATRTDTDGDGHADRAVTTHINTDQDVTTTYRDLNTRGFATSVVTEAESANKAKRSLGFDLDGDAQNEIVWSSYTETKPGEYRTTSMWQHHGDNLSFFEKVVVSPDGLNKWVHTDIDGDGDIDSTSWSRTTLNDDGSQTSRTDASYADGDTKATLVRDISADGRTVAESRDYDGDGKWDVKTRSVT
ncbi:beta strand repeat-containing protein, partial [Ruegeria atlantica]|uniref:beta strand repeat-containing protein n=1 Tax=Ruegeria atlantica TaxID=81569 RepID=UPI0034A04197